MPRALPWVALASLWGAAACVGTVGSEPGGSGPSNGKPPGQVGPGASDPGGTGNPSGAGGAGPAGPGPGGSQPVNTTGRPPLRRLTQVQFNNTVRDLLGFEGDFATGFPKDEDGTGFRANTNAPVSGTQVDKYEQAAELLGAKVTAEAAARLAPCLPPKAEADCAEEFVRGFGKRAFRRPLDNEQVARYRAVWQAGRTADGSFAAGVGLVVTAMLQSPHFLYLPEFGLDSAGGAGAGLVPLGSFEIAARLSYFLQDSMPDADLFAAADADSLKTPEAVAAQARRLLGTPRARDVSLGFFRQWLEIEALPALDKDAKTYPSFAPPLRDAMAAEIASFVAHVLGAGGGQLSTMLTAGYSFPKGPLVELYGLAPGAGGGDAKVDLPAGQRAGIMTLPGFMALYSHADQSAPVSRGYIVSEKLLCQTPPPPPDNLEVMIPKPDPNRSTRDRFAAHRADPQCASCHELMDPYGLTFEHYDGIGRYREKDGNVVVDASSNLARFGMVNNAVELMGKLAASKDVINCFTKQWFRFAFGRNEGPADDASLTAVQDAFERAELRIPDLLVALATSPAFRQRPKVVQP